MTITAATAAAAAAAEALWESVRPGRVAASPEDKRLYRHVALPNGLTALLVSDPNMASQPTALGEAEAAGGDGCGGEDEEMVEGDEPCEDEECDDDDEEEEDAEEDAEQGGTKRAAAALAVGLGSFGDPWDIQGLAHYTEHMVFMGSEAFPDENAYDKFLTEHGGGCNAFTESEMTVFHFDVQPDALRGALERFASQFTGPLFKAEAMEREVDAVDSEFHQVLQSDSVRQMQLQCATGTPRHPFTSFGWGNKKSIFELPRADGVDVRERLLAHHREHYRADRMCLVLLGAEPLDTLESWTRELFGPVPGDGGARPDYSSYGPPLAGAPAIHRAPAVKDEDLLTLTWQLPCLEEHYLSRPEDYVSHLVGHEGKGSLLSALKARGLATELYGGVGEGGQDRNSSAWLFNVGVTLTDLGVQRWEEVAGLVFQCIEIVRKAGPQEWVFRELQGIKAMEFRFHEEEDGADYTVRLACRLHALPPEHSVCGDYILRHWRPDLVQTVLDRLTPANVRIDFLSKAVDDAKLPKTDEWFGFRYGSEPLSDALLQSWAQATPAEDLALPPPNVYLPTDFELRAPPLPEGMESDEGASPDPPNLVSECPRLRLWHRLDDRFRTPRGQAALALEFPEVETSATAAACVELVVKLLEDAMNEETYLADVAGLRCSFSYGTPKVNIRVEGFSEKLPLLMRSALEGLMNLEVREDRFAFIKEAKEKEYRNRNMKPLDQSTYTRLHAIRATAWHVDARLEALRRTSLEDVRAFHKLMVRSAFAEGLMYGNVSREEALAFGEAVRGALPQAPLPREEWMLERCVQLPEAVEPRLVCVPTKNGLEDNSVVEAYFQIETAAHAHDATGLGAVTMRARALTDLVDQLMYEPYWNTLRTKEQLGYTVSSGMRLTLGVLGFACIVQSAAFSPAHCASRIDAFLTSFRESLASMDPAEFAQNRDALVAQKLERHKCQGEEVDVIWEAVEARHYDFATRETEAAMLKTLTMEDVLAFYDRYLLPGAPTRRQLQVRVYCGGHAASEGNVAFTDQAAVEVLKQSLACYPYFGELEPRALPHVRTAL